MKIALIGKIHEDGLKILEKEKVNILEINNLDENNLIEKLKDIDGIVLRTAKLNSKVLSECSKLKIIVRHGVGYDNVDLKYLNNNNIALGITSTSNAVSVAEHVLTLFLYLTKNLHLSDQLTRNGKFQDKFNLPNFFELYKKNILILGFGRIGQEVAKRCLGFESNVYVYDPFVDNQYIINNNCIPVEKQEGYKIADYITIHLPLNEKTKNLISLEEFTLFKKNLVLVNTARGGIINEKELFNALKEKKIAGAGLDVFENEPPPKNHPLFNLDNIVLSPHNAALTLECRKRMSVECAENIVYFFNNDKKLNINNIVNRKILKL